MASNLNLATLCLPKPSFPRLLQERVEKSQGNYRIQGRKSSCSFFSWAKLRKAWARFRLGWDRQACDVRTASAQGLKMLNATRAFYALWHNAVIIISNKYVLKRRSQQTLAYSTNA